MKKGWWTWSVFKVNGRKQSKPANLVAPPGLCLQWQRANAWQLNFHGFQQRHTLHMANSQACNPWRMIGFSLKRNESSCEKLCLQPWEKTWTLPLLNKSQALNQLLHKCPSLYLNLFIAFIVLPMHAACIACWWNDKYLDFMTPCLLHKWKHLANICFAQSTPIWSNLENWTASRLPPLIPKIPQVSLQLSILRPKPLRQVLKTSYPLMDSS